MGASDFPGLEGSRRSLALALGSQRPPCVRISRSRLYSSIPGEKALRSSDHHEPSALRSRAFPPNRHAASMRISGIRGRVFSECYDLKRCPQTTKKSCLTIFEHANHWLFSDGLFLHKIV